MQSKYALTGTAAHAALLPILHFLPHAALSPMLHFLPMLHVLQDMPSVAWLCRPGMHLQGPQEVRQSLFIPSATVTLHFFTKHQWL